MPRGGGTGRRVGTGDRARRKGAYSSLVGIVGKDVGYSYKVSPMRTTEAREGGGSAGFEYLAHTPRTMQYAFNTNF